MSFGSDFGTSNPATQSIFTFGTAATTKATNTPPRPTEFRVPSFGFGTPATSALTAFGNPAPTKATGFSTSTGFSTPAATAFGASTRQNKKTQMKPMIYRLE